MDIPSLSDVREMAEDEYREFLSSVEDDEQVEKNEVLRQLYTERVDEYRENPVPVPSCFGEGALVTLEYLGAYTEIRLLEEFTGVVVSASDSTLVLAGEQREAECRIDLEDYWAEVDMRQGVQTPTPDEGGVLRIKLVEAPWNTEHDGAATGHVLPMIHSEFEWVEDGPFTYPPQEFLEKHSEKPM